MSQTKETSLHGTPEDELIEDDEIENDPYFQLAMRIMEAIVDNENAGMCTCALKRRINDVIDGTYVRPDDNFDTWVDEAMEEMAAERAD